MLRYVLFIFQNGNGVEVILVVEEHIKTTCSHVIKLELIWHFAKQRTLFEEEGVDVQNLQELS